MKYIQVEPAYGRDYKTKKEVLADWNAGKDFRVVDFFGGNDGKAINLQDAQTEAASGPLTMKIRYKGQTQVAMVEVKP